MVSDLLRTRTISEGGGPEENFNDDTYPTSDQVDRLIDQATNAIFTQVPGMSRSRGRPPASTLLPCTRRS